MNAASLLASMSPPTDDPAESARRRLAAREAALPASRWARVRGMAGAGWRANALRRRGGPAADDVAALVASIGELKGLAMKAGQIVSYVDVTLPEDVRSALAVLQTQSQPMPFARVRAVVLAELGDAGAALAGAMDPAPVAAASIGQVHRARLPGGDRVAVKVQYPEVEQSIASDFSIAGIGPRIASLVYPGARIDGFIEEARARLAEECDYEHEARAQEEFRRIVADEPDVVVPRVLPEWSSRRVLTMEWIDGIGLDAWLATGPAEAERDRVGVALFRFYVGTLFRHHVYNCDPHPGNYLFLVDGRVAVLDYGCTRRFEPAFVAKLAHLTRAVHADDEALLRASLADLDFGGTRGAYDYATARGIVRAFFGPMLRDETMRVDLGEAAAMRDWFAKKRELMGLNLPGEFLFLFRIRFGLMSVLARIGARANWRALEEGFVDAALARMR